MQRRPACRQRAGAAAEQEAGQILCARLQDRKLRQVVEDPALQVPQHYLQNDLQVVERQPETVVFISALAAQGDGPLLPLAPQRPRGGAVVAVDRTAGGDPGERPVILEEHLTPPTSTGGFAVVDLASGVETWRAGA